jgi:hypothetical protein
MGSALFTTLGPHRHHHMFVDWQELKEPSRKDDGIMMAEIFESRWFHSEIVIQKLQKFTFHSIEFLRRKPSSSKINPDVPRHTP